MNKHPSLQCTRATEWWNNLLMKVDEASRFSRFAKKLSTAFAVGEIDSLGITEVDSVISAMPRQEV
jgi:hypothetical protein